MALLLSGLACATSAMAAKKVMCVKTNTGQYIEVVRISMMVVPDGGNTFEIVVKDGTGATGVQSISFEKHDSDIDLTKYVGNAPANDNPDLSKPVFLLTSTGKYFYMKEKPVMKVKEGSSKIDITVGSTIENDVEFVYFYRGPATNVGNMLGIDSPIYADGEEEKLTLQSPIHTQMQISGCGNATKAVLYSADGRKVAEAAVAHGASTLYVEHLPDGIYVVKVGKKSLKFIKN